MSRESKGALFPEGVALGLRVNYLSQLSAPFFQRNM